MIVSYIHPADQIVMFMRRIYDKGLTTTSGGNLSIRDAQGNLWITPAGIDKGTLTRRDIICVTPAGEVIGPTGPPRSCRSTPASTGAARTCGPFSTPIRRRW